MIQEDYCSYEIAKLLKEKGFDEPIDTYYSKDGSEIWPCNAWVKAYPNDYYPFCTHQMAMKWLRKEGVYMSVDTAISSNGNVYFNIDTYSEKSGWNHVVDFFDSYEEAIEEAIKYSLENLI